MNLGGPLRDSVSSAGETTRKQEAAARAPFAKIMRFEGEYREEGERRDSAPRRRRRAAEVWRRALEFSRHGQERWGLANRSFFFT